MKTIEITNDFKQGADDVIAKLQFNTDSEVANALYELLHEHPDWFTFEVSYAEREDGTKELTGVSLVSRHVKIK